MNAILTWALAQPSAQTFLPGELARVVDPDSDVFARNWESPMARKVLVKKMSTVNQAIPHFDPNITTILGGMCLITTVEMKQIYSREIVFSTEGEFEDWYSKWYPRIDQIHDAVGIPPRTCKKIIYVIEDSFFANRLASYTGLNRSVIQRILRRTHEKQGHGVLAKYLKTHGFSGELTCVCTSDIEKELEVALRMWERILGTKFRTCDRDFAKVELMYTGFWLDLLNVSGPGVIYEAASKMKLRGWVKLDPWFKNNPYGSKFNSNLGAVGYLPFLTTAGDGSRLIYSEVPNASNYMSFTPRTADLPWYITNLLFTKKSVIAEGPFSINHENASYMIQQDLRQYYNM